MSIQANEISEKAETVLRANGATINVYEDEQIVYVALPDGCEQTDEEEYVLPDGHIVDVSGEDLGAFWEHADPTKIYFKK